MELDRLTEFVAVARHKSIKKAAQELGLSCATLSARLQRLQEQLGTPLFIRNADGMSLTNSGELLLPNAIELLSAYRQLNQELNAAKTHYYHRLRIAVTGSGLPLYLGPFLDRLNLTFPNIHLDIMDDSRFGIMDVRTGDVDIYFAPVMSGFDPKELSMIPVATSGQYVILSRYHRLADRSMVSIRELDREQFILYPQTAESAIRDFQIRNLQDSGIHYSLYDSVTSPLFYKLLVPVGKGIVLRATPIFDLPPNTVRLPVTDLPHPATTCFFYDPDTQNPDVHAFVRDFPAFCKEEANEHHTTL